MTTGGDESRREPGQSLCVTSQIDRCRNAFFSALLLHQEGFPAFVLTDWAAGEWTIFLGSEDLAKRLLLRRAQVLSEAVRWRAFPCRMRWLSEPYSPLQIAQWVQQLRVHGEPGQAPYPDYAAWLEKFVARLATRPDALPSIGFARGELTAWLHFRNPDLSSKGVSIERYQPSPPLPRGFEEERRQLTMTGSEDFKGWWPASQKIEIVDESAYFEASDRRYENWYENRISDLFDNPKGE